MLVKLYNFKAIEAVVCGGNGIVVYSCVSVCLLSFFFFF